MIEKLLRSMSFVFILFVVVAAMSQTASKGNQAGKPEVLPPPRAIPEIIAKDQFPRACVDCRLNYTEQKNDVRFSTLIHPHGLPRVPRQDLDDGATLRADAARHSPDRRKGQPLSDGVPGRVHALPQTQRRHWSMVCAQRARALSRKAQEGTERN
jgi:hypothetical protein